jgi:hypothetical protein
MSPNVWCTALPDARTISNCWTWWASPPELPPAPASAAWHKSIAPSSTAAAGPSFLLHAAHRGKIKSAQPLLQVLILPLLQSSVGSSQPVCVRPA